MFVVLSDGTGVGVVGAAYRDAGFVDRVSDLDDAAFDVVGGGGDSGGDAAGV